jgi:hypothetical protein
MYAQTGVGSYNKIGNWTWMFAPPPYGFTGPANPSPDPPIRWNGLSGLSGCAGGCGCGGKCGDKHDHGMGFFSSGMDFNGWGAAEWGIVALGGYLALSIIGDAFTVGRAAREGGRRTKRAYRALRGK